MIEPVFSAWNWPSDELAPIFDAFCAEHGFSRAPKSGLGRYPRIRIEREREIKLWFDLWMEFDAQGRRYPKFERNSPFELSAGAYFKVEDGSPHGARVQLAVVCFARKPFDQVGEALAVALRENLKIVAGWDADHIRNNGKIVQLRGPEKTQFS